MMLKWLPFAMVRITIVFIGGILSGLYRQELITYPIGMVVLLCLVFSYFVCYRLIRKSASSGFISGLIGLTIIFLAGYFNAINHIDFNNIDHLTKVERRIDYYFGRITGVPEERNHSHSVEIEISRIKSGSAWMRVTGKSLVYIAKDSSVFDLHHGDKVLVKGPLSEVSPPGNPGEFDFREFLRHKNISHQQFMRRNHIQLVERQPQINVLSYSQKVRRWASSKIEMFVSGKRAQAITKALVLGVTEGLDNDLLGAYAASGTMHILSVSGLHVGIIYAIILFLLAPLKNLPWSKWLVAIMSLACLWAYAFVTGMSPSVLRAVTMFSFIAIARPFGRQTNIYNTLAASAFLLLIDDPFLIVSVGFQLSYLAVVGIVYLYRPLYNLWEPSFWLWDKAWQAVCVSVAAQLATFALGLYYFHQFPVYFLLSNLIVIPLSSLVLLTGIFLLAISSITLVAGLVGIVMQFLIGWLNGSVFLVEGLPGSLIGGVHITALQCWMLLTVMVFLVLLLEHRKFRFAVATLSVIGLFSVIEWNTLMNEKAHGQFIVYQIPGHGAMEWIDHDQSWCYADSGLLSNPDLIRFHIQPNRIMSGVRRSEVNPSDIHTGRILHGFRFLRHQGISVVWIESGSFSLPDKITTDYLVIGKDAVKSLEEIRDRIKFRQLIFDSSNSTAYSDRLVREAGSQKIAAYSVMSRGAFIITL